MARLDVSDWVGIGATAGFFAILVLMQWTTNRIYARRERRRAKAQLSSPAPAASSPDQLTSAAAPGVVSANGSEQASPRCRPGFRAAGSNLPRKPRRDAAAEHLLHVAERPNKT
jgi:hypothetical protein